MLVTKNVKSASTIVTEIFPVTLAPKGKMGISPNKLVNKIKKKSVRSGGINFL